MQIFAAVLLTWLLAFPLQAQGRISAIPVPSGCRRLPLDKGSYAQWLRNLPLKSGPAILSHSRDTVFPGGYRVLAVLEMPLLFRDDLEQCADWCFRLWAEHHRQTDRLERLYLFDYHGQKRYLRSSGKTWRQFLRWAMANANSHSLKVGCLPVDTSDLLPGDMIVQNLKGGVGHVSVIMDVCDDTLGNRYFLIGYGYMPAQEFHLEAADSARGRDGWFSLKGYLDYLEHYFGGFGPPAFRRFP